jgi:uncharacterized membrane protein
MDTVAKSMRTGRLAAPLFYLIAFILQYWFGVVIDEAQANQLIVAINNILSALAVIWGTYTSIRSKYRQRKECNDVRSEAA